MSSDEDEDDPWPDEPAEVDPEARWGNPERDLPNVPVAPDSTPETDDVPESTHDAEDVEADPEVAGAFWIAVAMANFGVLGVSLGLLLIFFRSMWLVGGALTVFGAIFVLRTYQHVRAFRSRADGND